jgi:hypothetical protein
MAQRLIVLTAWTATGENILLARAYPKIWNALYTPIKKGMEPANLEDVFLHFTGHALRE